MNVIQTMADVNTHVPMNKEVTSALVTMALSWIITFTDAEVCDLRLTAMLCYISHLN